MTRRTWLACFILTGAVGGVVAACSLNPQPIPPGDVDDGGAAGRAGDDGASKGGDFSDSGGTPPGNGDAGDSGSLTENPEAGDASDAGFDAPDAPDAAD